MPVQTFAELSRGRLLIVSKNSGPLPTLAAKPSQRLMKNVGYIQGQQYTSFCQEVALRHKVLGSHRLVGYVLSFTI